MGWYPQSTDYKLDKLQFKVKELDSGSSRDLWGKIDTIVKSPVDTVKASQTATTGGRKFDGGKLQYGLVPPNALKATVEILTFGAEKYEPDNWKWVPDSKRRYFDAAMRHLWAWKSGEQNDQETGKNHIAHALCCLMFLYEHDTIDFLNDDEAKK